MVHSAQSERRVDETGLWKSIWGNDDFWRVVLKGVGW